MSNLSVLVIVAGRNSIEDKILGLEELKLAIKSVNSNALNCKVDLSIAPLKATT